MYIYMHVCVMYVLIGASRVIRVTDLACTHTYLLNNINSLASGRVVCNQATDVAIKSM